MQKHEAATIIEEIIGSLKSDPHQFQVSVNVSVSGMSATSQGGGIGAQGVAIGGGTGISASASADNATVEIASKKGTAEMDKEFHRLIDALSEIAAEFRSEKPDASKIHRIYESIRDKWVPGVITSLIGNLITLAMTT